MKADDIKNRIEKLKIEKSQLDKRQRNLEALMNKKKKNEDTRRKIVLGALILKELEKNKGLQNYVVGLLNTLGERDKLLFKELILGQQAQKNQWPSPPKGLFFRLSIQWIFRGSGKQRRQVRQC